jgi:outer membrane lipase/esterase
MRSKTSLLLACAGAFAVSNPAVFAQQAVPYSAVVVFGTSLSDPGNAFALRGAVNTPPDYLLDPLLVPSAPYARGGHHFSNGPTWIEQLARSWGLAGSVRPAFASKGGAATNYAVGAARAYDDGQNVNLDDQVQAFLADHGDSAPSDALYVVEMGSNDIRDAIVAFQAGGSGAAQAVLQQALASIGESIQVLYGAGGRHFLVWLPPDVSLTPAIRTLNQSAPGIAQLGSTLTAMFNANLSGLLAQLTNLPGITIATLDAFTLLNQIVADPQAYDLVEVTRPCISPEGAPFFCQTPDAYLFWDGIHPSSAAHAITAAAAAAALGQ